MNRPHGAPGAIRDRSPPARSEPDDLRRAALHSRTLVHRPVGRHPGRVPRPARAGRPAIVSATGLLAEVKLNQERPTDGLQLLEGLARDTGDSRYLTSHFRGAVRDGRSRRRHRRRHQGRQGRSRGCVRDGQPGRTLGGARPDRRRAGTPRDPRAHGARRHARAALGRGLLVGRAARARPRARRGHRRTRRPCPLDRGQRVRQPRRDRRLVRLLLRRQRDGPQRRRCRREERDLPAGVAGRVAVGTGAGAAGSLAAPCRRWISWGDRTHW